MEAHASTSYANDRNRLLKAIIASALLHLLLLLIKFHFSAPNAPSQTQVMAQPDLQLHLLPAESGATAPVEQANANLATSSGSPAPEHTFEAELAAARPVATVVPPPPDAGQSKPPLITPQPQTKKALTKRHTTAVANAPAQPQPPQKSLKLLAVEETRDDTFTVPPPAEGAHEGASNTSNTDNPTPPQLAQNSADSVVPTDNPVPQPLNTSQQEREKQAQEEFAQQQAEAQRLAEIEAEQKRTEQQAAEALAAKLRQQALEEEARRQAALEAQRLAEAQAEQQRLAERQAAEARAAAALAEKLRQQALEEEARKQAALEAKRLAEAQAEQQRLAAKQAEEAKAAAALAAKLRQQALEEEARKQAALEAQRLAEAQAEQQRLAEKLAAEARAAEARRQAQAEQARLLAAQEAKRIADQQVAAAAAARSRLAQEGSPTPQRSVATMPPAGQQTLSPPAHSQTSAALASGTAQPSVGNTNTRRDTGTGTALAANERSTDSGKSNSGNTARGTDLKPAGKAIVVQTQHAFLDDACSQKVTGRHVQIDLYASVWRHQVRLNAPSYLLDYVKTLPHVSPIVTVTIRSDGNIENINFDRSSGRPEIDNVIARMVQFLTPFKAFPKDLAVECEVIAFPSIWTINNGLNVTWAGQ